MILFISDKYNKYQIRILFFIPYQYRTVPYTQNHNNIYYDHTEVRHTLKLQRVEHLLTDDGQTFVSNFRHVPYRTVPYVRYHPSIVQLHDGCWFLPVFTITENIL